MLARLTEDGLFTHRVLLPRVFPSVAAKRSPISRRKSNDVTRAGCAELLQKIVPLSDRLAAFLSMSLLNSSFLVADSAR